jgi:hypothetical protein
VECYVLTVMATISVGWDVTSCNFIYWCQGHRSAVNMGAAGSSETLTSIHQTARCHIPEYNIVQNLQNSMLLQRQYHRVPLGPRGRYMYWPCEVRREVSFLRSWD